MIWKIECSFLCQIEYIGQYTILTYDINNNIPVVFVFFISKYIVDVVVNTVHLFIEHLSIDSSNPRQLYRFIFKFKVK